MNDSTMIKIIELGFDYSQPELKIATDWYALIIVILVVIVGFIVYRILKKRNFNIVEMDVEISGAPKTKFKVRRDDSNIYIANRIYIELITRKAAIPIDEENDVLVEVYDSWYKLFNIIRDEIKNVPGYYLRSHNPTTALIGLTTNILNHGLRPHLTTYQARFRKWYASESKKEYAKNISPQELQKKFESYDELVKDMKDVNKVLIDYAEQLHKLIKGK